MKSKFWTSDRIVSFSAIFISLLTLMIFIRQTNIIERQSRLSSMPYLMVETSNNAEDHVFEIEIVNHGVGPAIIERRIISYKNKEYNMEFQDFLREYITEMDSVSIVSSSTVQVGLAIPAGESREIMKVAGGKKSYDTFLQIIQELLGEDGDFDYEIQYRSIYDDRWQIGSKTDIPTELK